MTTTGVELGQRILDGRLLLGEMYARLVELQDAVRHQEEQIERQLNRLALLEELRREGGGPDRESDGSGRSGESDRGSADAAVSER